jgi:hypothetical protein
MANERQRVSGLDSVRIRSRSQSVGRDRPVVNWAPLVISAKPIREILLASATSVSSGMPGLRRRPGFAAFLGLTPTESLTGAIHGHEMVMNVWRSSRPRPMLRSRSIAPIAPSSTTRAQIIIAKLGGLSDELWSNRRGPLTQHYKIDDKLLRTGSANISSSGKRGQDMDLIVMRPVSSPTIKERRR